MGARWREPPAGNPDITARTPLKERANHNGRVHATLNQLKADESGTAWALVPGRPEPGRRFTNGIRSGAQVRFTHVADEGMTLEDDYSQ